MMLIQRVLSSSLFSSVAVYALSNAINSAIPFFILPIITRYLTPHDYGIVSMFQVLCGIIGPLTGFSIQGAISRRFYDSEQVDISIYIANCLLILLTSTVVIGGICLIFASQISKLSSFPAEWVWSIIIFSASQFLIQVTLVLWQVRENALAYGLFQVLLTTTSVGMSVWLVVGFELGWKGSLLGQVLAYSIFSVLALVIIIKNGDFKYAINWSYIKNALNYGIPLIPHAIGAIFMSVMDRMFITNLVGLSSTGIYVVGYQVGMVIGLIENSFNQAWVPWLYSRLKLNDEDVKLRIVRLSYAYSIGILVLAFLVGLFAPVFLKYFVSNNFSGSASVVLWIAVGFAFNGMYKMVTNYIFFAERTSLLAWVTFITAGVNVVMLYFLVPKNGIIGAAQATTLTFLLKFLFTWLLSSRVFKMPWLMKI